MSIGVPQGTVRRILTRQKQQNISYRVDAAVSLKYLHTKIGPGIHLMRPVYDFLTDTNPMSTWAAPLDDPVASRQGELSC